MEFNRLMELAAKQTQASQAAFAKENELRIAREKLKLIEEERKEKERIRLEKERLAKQKREDQIKEQKLLEERQRRQAERAAAIANNISNVETSKVASSSSGRTKILTPNHHHRKVINNVVVVTKHQDPEEVRRLEREEKLARARARLFDEPISISRKKPNTTSNTANKRAMKGKSKMIVGSSRAMSSNSSTTTMSARQQIEKEFNKGERKALNTVKRDRRTIEEVERDMRLRKGISTNPVSRGEDVFFDPRKRQTQKTKTINNRSSAVSNDDTSSPNKRQRVSLPSSSTSRQPESIKKPCSSAPFKRSNGTQVRGTRKQESEDESEDYDEESEEEEEEEGHSVPVSVRDQIWEIMGKKRSSYTNRDIFSDEEGSEDMEVAADELLEEENKAAALARKEDLREQEMLKKHEIEKKKRLANIHKNK